MFTLKIYQIIFFDQLKMVLRSVSRIWILVGLSLLVCNSEAAGLRAWREVRDDLILRVEKAQSFANELDRKSQEMEFRLFVLRRESDRLHSQIGDLERQIEQKQPVVEEMKGALRALHERLQSTVNHRDDTQNKFNQERDAIESVLKGYANCVRDAWIFAGFCGAHPSDQEGFNVRKRQLGEWMRLIDEDNRNIEDLNEQVRNQFASTVEEVFALRALKADQDRLTTEITATASEATKIRGGWLCITPKIEAILSRTSHIETLTQEKLEPFIRAALDILTVLESDIQNLQESPSADPQEICSVA